MALLDGFTYLDFKEGEPFMLLSEHGVTFSKGVTESLGFPEKAIFLVDEEWHRCAIRAVDLNDPRGVDYYSLQNMPDEKIHWKSRHLASSVAELGGFDLTKNDFRFEGYPLPDEDAVMFDAHTAVAVAKKR